MNNPIGAEKMRSLARFLKRKLPNMGFALFVFPLNKPGMANYISNATRETMIKALEEKLERFKNNKDFQTPEEN